MSTVFLLVCLQARKERKGVVWSKEVDRFINLEEIAGKLIEELGSYRSIPTEGSQLAEELRILESQAGRFARYPKVRQAIRDLHNVLSRMLAAKADHEDDREIRQELDPAYQTLLCACDAVLRERQI